MIYGYVDLIHLPLYPPSRSKVVFRPILLEPLMRISLRDSNYRSSLPIPFRGMEDRPGGRKHCSLFLIKPFLSR